MANQKDLANGLIGTALTSVATTLVLQAGYGASMPTVPFFLTLTPVGQLSTRGNSEIVRVTARNGDTLTIERAQKGTAAKAFSVGDIVSNSIYAEGSFDSLDVDGDIYSNGKKVMIATTGIRRELGDVIRDNVSSGDISLSQNIPHTIKDTNGSDLTLNITNSKSTIYVVIEGTFWGASGYKNVVPLLDGVQMNTSGSTKPLNTSPVTYLGDQVTAAYVTFRQTGVSLGTHTLKAAIFRPGETGSVNYRNVRISAYEIL